MAILGRGDQNEQTGKPPLLGGTRTIQHCRDIGGKQSADDGVKREVGSWKIW